MKYMYYDINNRLIAESNSEISFNLELFPAWKDLIKVVKDTKSYTKKRKLTYEEETK